MLDLSKVKIGTDTELFLVEKETGKFKSAIGLIGGSKGRPVDIGNCCGLEEDNVSVELTVPAVDLQGGLDEMWSNLEFVLKVINEKIPLDLKVECCPSAIFEEQELLHPKAIEFGCQPDYDAWDGGQVNPRPSAGLGIRSCGGHIHVGYEEPDVDISIELVKHLDLYLGVPSVLLDTDTLRRKLYGRAGAFRIKDYGVEYRVLSNFWIKSKEGVRFVFNGVQKALESYNSGKNVDKYADVIREIINTSNTELAKGFLHKEFANVLTLA